MTETVTSLLQAFEELSLPEQRELFDALEDRIDGALAEQSMQEFRASGSKGIPAREAFALARKAT